MVRLAPSAVNRQPWRIVVQDGTGKGNTGGSTDGNVDGGKVFHFYQTGIKPDDKESSDMHRIIRHAKYYKNKFYRRKL